MRRALFLDIFYIIAPTTVNFYRIYAAMCETVSTSLDNSEEDSHLMS